MAAICGNEYWGSITEEPFYSDPSGASSGSLFNSLQSYAVTEPLRHMPQIVEGGSLKETQVMQSFG